MALGYLSTHALSVIEIRHRTLLISILISVLIDSSSATAISSRLKELISLGLVSRDENQTITYSLTDYGKLIRKDLKPLLEHIGEFV